MASKLPTTEQLRQLLKDKGKDALVWYTWRNALRTLPLLGHIPLIETWSENTLEHSIAICRIPILLAIYNTERIKMSFFASATVSSASAASSASASSTAAYAAAYAAAVSVYASAAATAAATTAASATASDAASVAASVAASAADDAASADVAAGASYANHYHAADYANAYADADAAASVAVSNATTAAAIADTDAKFADAKFADAKFADAKFADAKFADAKFADANAAANADYIFLKSVNNFSAKKNWFSKDLWPFTKKNQLISKPLYFDENCFQLYKNLTDLGLDFMANDLMRLWQGEINPIQAHWKNYAKSLSKENFKSAASFREVILGDFAEINAVRVLLLGSGGAGKTTLSDRLQNKPTNKKTIIHKATIGIDHLENKPLNLQGKKSAFLGLDVPKGLKLFLWDFGGQTLFYGLHKSFLHENCVYVLVVDNRHEQAPDEWLQQIKHLVGENTSPPILIVSNEYENCYQQQNEQRLKREFKQFNLQFFYFPCNHNQSEQLQLFKQTLLNTADQSRYIIAQGLLNTAKRVEEIFQDNAVVDVLELEDILEQHINADTSIDIMISQLEGLGRVINLEDTAYNKRYCLNPAWVVDYAYHLLYLESLKQSNGTIQYLQLKREAWRYFSKKDKNKKLDYPKLSLSNIDDLLNFLQKSRVCKKLQGDKLFFPDIASANEPKKVQDYLNDQNKTASLVEFHLPYLPISLAAHLVCRWLEENHHDNVIINSIDDVWREGFILSHQKQKDSLLIVQYQTRKSVLLIHCFGRKEGLDDLLRAIWKGLLEEIRPIKAEDILFFVGMDRNSPLLNLTPNKILSDKQVIQKKQENDIVEIFKKMMGKNMGNKTVNNFNGQIMNSQILSGDKNNIEQNNSSDQKITEANQAEILQTIIKEFRKSDDLSGQQFLRLSELQVQIEENTIDGSFYKRLDMDIGTVANISTIATALGSMIGLG